MFSNFVPDNRVSELDNKREEISEKLTEMVNYIKMVKTEVESNIIAEKIEEIRKDLFYFVNFYRFPSETYAKLNGWQHYFLKLDALYNKLLRSSDSEFEYNTRALIEAIFEYHKTIVIVRNELEQKKPTLNTAKDEMLLPQKLKGSLSQLNMPRTLRIATKKILEGVYTAYHQYYHGQLPLELFDSSRTIINNMGHLYDLSPRDFPSLFLFLHDIVLKLSNNFTSHHAKGDIHALDDELQIFYQQVTAHYFQMQVYFTFNYICCDQVLFNPLNKVWGQSFNAINKFMEDTYGKLQKSMNKSSQDNQEFISVMKMIQSLKDKFITLSGLISDDDNRHPAITSGRLCIVSLNNLLNEYTDVEMNAFKPILLEKILNSIDQMETNLADWIVRSFEDYESKPMRMQIGKAVSRTDEVPEISAVTSIISPTTEITATVTEIMSPLDTVIATIPDENYLVSEEYPIAQSVFYLSSPKQNVVTPFSFFKERDSAKALRIKADQYDLICEDVPGNGSCLLSAIALALDFKSHPDYSHLTLREAANELRKKANQYIKVHPVDFQDFIEEVTVVENTQKEPNASNQPKENKTYEARENLKQYVDKLDNEIVWADHYHLIALCKALKLKVFVLNSDHTPPIITGVPDARYEICLGYEVNENGKGMHYQALFPKDKSGVLPQKVRDLMNSEKVDWIRPSQHTNESSYKM